MLAINLDLMGKFRLMAELRHESDEFTTWDDMRQPPALVGSMCDRWPDTWCFRVNV